MRAGLNLRGDISKLSNLEVERQFDQLVSERIALAETIDHFTTLGNKFLYEKGWGMPFGRGPIRSPYIYRIAAVLYGGSSARGLGRLYMIDCELKDLMDECRRRIRHSERSNRT